MFFVSAFIFFTFFLQVDFPAPIFINIRDIDAPSSRQGNPELFMRCIECRTFQ